MREILKMGLFLAVLFSLVGGCRVTWRSGEGWKVGSSGSGSSGGSGTSARKRTGPPDVALFRPTVASGLGSAIKEDKLNELWRKEFVNDRRFKFVDQGKVDKAKRHESRGRYNALLLGNAARIYLTVGSAKRTGYDRKRKKAVQVTVMTLTATVQWKVSGVVRTAKVEGSFLQNVQLMKKLAGKVKNIVLSG